MFDRHQAEITVMQFTGHSLPVHQSVTVPWDEKWLPTRPKFDTRSFFVRITCRNINSECKNCLLPAAFPIACGIGPEKCTQHLLLLEEGHLLPGGRKGPLEQSG